MNYGRALINEKKGNHSMAFLCGMIGLICIVILTAKFLTRISAIKKADEFLWKLHKPASGILFLSAIAHIAVQIPFLTSKSMQSKVSGIFVLAAAVVLVAACHMIKETGLKMRIHRILTVALAGIAALHLAFRFL
ncbi:MAG: hypothetical protein HFG80_10510 [Eubacterium sp.]|nr:hypothetical protein [Eubacterium sp.]